MSRDTYYFPHDFNARNDPKLASAISVYGVEAYAWFFMIIEILREQTGYKLAINKYTWNTLAMQLHSDAEKIKNFVSDCCNEFVDDNGSLLVMDNKNLWSVSLLRRMEAVDVIRKKRSEAAQARWLKAESRSNANEVQVQCKSNAIKEKKIKENNNINTLNNTTNEPETTTTTKEKSFLVPTLIEVVNYCKERSNSINPEQFIDYYTANGWKVGKNKMKDWKAAVRTWEQNENNGGKTNGKSSANLRTRSEQEQRYYNRELF